MTAARWPSSIMWGKKKTLSGEWFTIQGVAWSPDGKEIWFTASKSGVDRTLYATTLDGKERMVLRLPGAVMIFDIFKDGRVLLMRASWRRELIGMTDRRCQAARSFLAGLQLSGRLVGGRQDLALRRGGRRRFSRLLQVRRPVLRRLHTKDRGSPAVLLGEGGAVALSPDGKSVIAQTQDSPSQLRLLTTGAGEAKDLTKDNMNHTWSHWFPDGKRILFSGNEPGKGVKFYIWDIASRKSEAISPEGVNGTAFVISPDSQ